MPRLRSSPTAAAALVGVATLAARWIERLLASHEPPLTLAQFLALRAIAAEPLSGVELARRAGVSGPAISQLLAALEATDWIDRAQEPEDRRRRPLALTPEGARVLRSATRLAEKRMSELLGGLPRHEAHRLGRVLEQVEQALSGSPPPRRPPPAPPRRP